MEFNSDYERSREFQSDMLIRTPEGGVLGRVLELSGTVNAIMLRPPKKAAPEPTAAMICTHA